MTEPSRAALERLTERVRREHAPFRRAALRKALLAAGVAAMEERDRLAARLSDGWDWLRGHPDAEDYGGREETWCAWLREYEATEEALAAARAALGP